MTPSHYTHTHYGQFFMQQHRDTVEVFVHCSLSLFGLKSKSGGKGKALGKVGVHVNWFTWPISSSSSPCGSTIHPTNAILLLLLTQRPLIGYRLHCEISTTGAYTLTPFSFFIPYILLISDPGYNVIGLAW